MEIQPHKSDLTRSQTAPQSDATVATAVTAADTMQRPAAPRRASTISFAAAPLDDAFRTPQGGSTPKLEVASVSAIARNFTPLAVAYADIDAAAQPQAKTEALRMLAIGGSHMFADYLDRTTTIGADLAWDLRVSKPLKNDNTPTHRSSLLGEALSMRYVMKAHGRIFRGAEKMRTLMLADVQQVTNAVFGSTAKTPAMCGALVGCMLDGAAHLVADLPAGLGAETKKERENRLAALVAFCNAVEREFAKPTTQIFNACNPNAKAFWTVAFEEKPATILERCANGVQREADPEFTAALLAVRAYGFGAL